MLYGTSLRQVVLEILCLAVVVDDAVLQPAVNRGDDDVHDGVCAQGEVADLADLDGLARPDVLEHDGDLIGTAGQQVEVARALLFEGHVVRVFPIARHEAELLEALDELRLCLAVEFGIDGIAFGFEFGEQWETDHKASSSHIHSVN